MSAKKTKATAVLSQPVPIPKFSAQDAHGKKVTNESLRGKWHVVYFYPKDMTPGCTLEAMAFAKANEKFHSLGCSIVGVSKDSCASHIKFAERLALNFTLLSDGDGSMCEAFQVYKQKSMFGMKYMGIERSTFLCNPQGLIVAQWNKVKVTGHVDDVLSTLKALQ